MSQTLLPRIEASYDKVGSYSQDAVNGFSEEFLDRMLDFVELDPSISILDAMAGNGNLTVRLYDYCQHRGIAFPDVVVLEFSQVQSNLAKTNLLDTPSQVIWGDVLMMENLETGERLLDHTFDRVMIKSGNHEIPMEQQIDLYRSICRVLKPGGLFINLGFLFDDTEERDQFRELTRFKDRAAGLASAAKNRHFLTREEFYSQLQQVGFVDVRCGMHFHYTIDSSIVVKTYFPEHEWECMHADVQAQQAKAMLLRRRGRIHFQGDNSMMICPGEITIARRTL
jgi:ubiquinone/menaquinone biosynthesis C-methylase UbiE